MGVRACRIPGILFVPASTDNRIECTGVHTSRASALLFDD
jgi:hypothetical protein